MIQPEENRTFHGRHGYVVPSEDCPPSLRHSRQINHPSHRPQSSISHRLNVGIVLLESLGVHVSVNKAAHSIVHDLDKESARRRAGGGQEEGRRTHLVVLCVQPGASQTELGGELHPPGHAGQQLVGLLTEVQQLQHHQSHRGSNRQEMCHQTLLVRRAEYFRSSPSIWYGVGFNLPLDFSMIESVSFSDKIL